MGAGGEGTGSRDDAGGVPLYSAVGRRPAGPRAPEGLTTSSVQGKRAKSIGKAAGLRERFSAESWSEEQMATEHTI